MTKLYSLLKMSIVFWCTLWKSVPKEWLNAICWSYLLLENFIVEEYVAFGLTLLLKTTQS